VTLEETNSLSVAERRDLIRALNAALAVCGKARSVNMELFFELIAVRDRPDKAKPELVALRNLFDTIAALDRFNIATQQTLGLNTHIDFQFLLGWMLSRAQNVGASRTVDGIQRYLEAEHIEVVETLAFTGATFDRRMKVTDFVLRPWANLTQTDTTWSIQVKALNGRPMPDAVVTRRHTIQARHLRPWDQPVAQPIRSIEPARNVLRSITAERGTGIRMTDYWFEPPAWAPWIVERSSFGLDTSRLSFPEHVEQRLGPKISRTARRLLALDEATAARFHVPLDRLNASLLKGFVAVDAAIDLGIALESLFSPSKQENGIGAGIRSRAARFLGGTIKQRTEVANLVRDIYGLRSLAVHSGQIGGPNCPKKWRSESAVISSLKEGQKLVGRALVEMLDRGEPDWEEFDLIG
jgi:Apea-like HEPN